MFELHEKAIANINETADSLIDLLVVVPLPESDTKSCNDDLYVSANITEKDILNVEFTLSNVLGEEVAKYFYKDKIPYGYINESYQNFCSVVQKIYKNKSVSMFVSYKYLRDKLFAWVKSKILCKEKDSFYDFLLKVCKTDVVEREVIIPIPYTMSVKEFCFGQLSFKTITEDMIEKWFEQANSGAPKDATMLEKIEAFKTNLKKEIQGYIAGIFVCTAEVIRAQELAYMNLSVSLSFLRLLSHANFDYKMDCVTHEYGKSFVINREFLEKNKKTNAVSYNTAVLNKTLVWNIDHKTINYLYGPFKKAHELLLMDSLNNYQEKLINAIIIYSKHTISHEIYDKILYILVAMESMLLKTDTEPIQQNIGQRLSYLIGKNLEERKEIVRNIKGIYSIRSKYIHHGVIDFKDDELMRTFMHFAWLAFSKMIEKIDVFKTKDDLIEYLDNLLLS